MRQIATRGVPRLAIYYRTLLRLEENRQEIVSSEELGRKTGHTDSQIRRDLASFGNFGIPGIGYKVKELRKKLGKILGKDKNWKVALVGVGNLGSALLAYNGFAPQGFHIAAAFDNDLRKIGKKWKNIEIQNVRDLKEIISSQNIKIGIVAVPASGAQEVVEELLRSGVRAILNFAPTRVSVPEGVEVENVDLSIELDRLSYFLEKRG
jgi:redox-sensing transcriptional repressor